MRLGQACFHRARDTLRRAVRGAAFRVIRVWRQTNALARALVSCIGARVSARVSARVRSLSAHARKRHVDRRDLVLCVACAMYACAFRRWGGASNVASATCN